MIYQNKLLKDKEKIIVFILRFVLVSADRLYVKKEFAVKRTKTSNTDISVKIFLKGSMFAKHLGGFKKETNVT